jgi:hypothetical protein
VFGLANFEIPFVHAVGHGNFNVDLQHTRAPRAFRLVRPDKSLWGTSRGDTDIGPTEIDCGSGAVFVGPLLHGHIIVRGDHGDDRIGNCRYEAIMKIKPDFGIL